MNIYEFAGVNRTYHKPNGEKMSHEDVYTKVVNGIGLDVCAAYMPATVERLRDALAKDPHLNTIPLKQWDDMQSIRHAFHRIKVNSLSLSQIVCTLKQAARMLVAREYPNESAPKEKIS